jgi:hypothetical protein
MYNDLTGNFPFMSLDGSVCFLVMYHYEANAIFAIPIAGLDDVTIFEAYKTKFDELTAKGLRVKLNIMDNQATKHIKKFLTEEQCKLQLVEPHNHRMNAAERAIQTWKDAFIAALATTYRDFPIQLWDRIAPQVQDLLNLLRASRIDPTKSAYEIVNGPYDWNRYPLAPLGCKAVIYKDGDIRGSWASRGVDGWYLGPSKDHYRCNLYFVPETRAYRISGSTELFPQHCQVPNLTQHQHLRALTEELADVTTSAGTTAKGRALIKKLQVKIKHILTPQASVATPRAQQRVREDEQRVRAEKQRVQSRHVQRWRHTGFMGITRRGRMVPRTIKGSLPMQPVLRSRNKSIQDIGINRTVPPTLPGTKSYAAPAPTSTHRGTGRRDHQRRNYSQRKSTHQKITGEDQAHPHTPSISSDTASATKGEGG